MKSFLVLVTSLLTSLASAAIAPNGEFPQGIARAGYKATTVLNRSEFGIETFPGVVGEEITVTVNLEIIKQ